MKKAAKEAKALKIYNKWKHDFYAAIAEKRRRGESFSSCKGVHAEIKRWHFPRVAPPMRSAITGKVLTK